MCRSLMLQYAAKILNKIMERIFFSDTNFNEVEQWKKKV